VLIVDDNEDVRTLLRVVLTHHGLETAEAADGRVAVDLAGDYEPDLVILDDQMPVMTGTEALAELRRVVPSAAILLYSWMADGADSRPERVDAYLRKGSDLDSLLSLVDRLTGTAPHLLALTDDKDGVGEL
jgi:two-component system, NtrC family, response regulator AtoC